MGLQLYTKAVNNFIPLFPPRGLSIWDTFSANQEQEMVS